MTTDTVGHAPSADNVTISSAALTVRINVDALYKFTFHRHHDDDVELLKPPSHNELY